VSQNLKVLVGGEDCKALLIGTCCMVYLVEVKYKEFQGDVLSSMKLRWHGHGDARNS